MNFSVLMSVYYKESPSFLKEALDSVINQTVKPKEIVCIKDGPLTEELEQVLDLFVSENQGLFKFISFEKNKGLGIALQEGVLACTYPIIARMDTDDISREDRFEKQLLFMSEKNLDIVGSNILEFDGDITNVLSKRIVPESDRAIKRGARKRNPFNHMTVMYKKDAVLRAGNYNDFLWFEDYNLWVRMIKNGARMYNIQDNLVYARTGSNMFERRGGIKYIGREYKMQKNMFKLKFISFGRFMINMLVRGTVRVVPNRIRKIIYMKLLR